MHTLHVDRCIATKVCGPIAGTSNSSIILNHWIEDEKTTCPIKNCESHRLLVQDANFIIVQSEDSLILYRIIWVLLNVLVIEQIMIPIFSAHLIQHHLR